MKVLTLFLALTFSIPALTQSSVSDVWVADKGDTYKNPVLYADYSDPDVARVGNDYYMTASSFNVAPGLPVLHSKDMVNWELINHALPEQLPDSVFSVPQHGNGVWAPSIRYHNNELYIYWGDPDFGIYMVKTDDPYGTWEDPVLVLKGKGLIDPSPLWDTDSTAYLVHAYAGSRAGVNSLLTVREMNTEGTKVIGEGKHVFDGHDQHPTVEGAKFYKRNGYYYIFAPAGGVATGWQLALRSKHIYGPYEEKIVLEQGSTETNGPHQGAWVETPTGEDWFYHFQEVQPYGRIVHLQPMRWEDDWPVMGKDIDGNGIGEPVSAYKKPAVRGTHPVVTPPETDEFTGREIGLQWQWQANPDIVWHAKLGSKDYLRLFSIKPAHPVTNLWEVPHLLLQKFPGPAFTATTSIELHPPEEADYGKKAGLIIMGRDYAYLSVSHDENGFFVQQTECINAEGGAEEVIEEEQRISGNKAYFRVQVQAPDGHCKFSYSEDGENFQPIGNEFAAREGKWIGAKIGLFSISDPEVPRYGYADIDFFRITD